MLAQCTAERHLAPWFLQGEAASCAVNSFVQSMGMNQLNSTDANFGKRREVHSVTISSHGKIRQFKVHPAALALISGIFFVGLAGYLVATAYLVFRDDLINSAIISRAQMKHEYEDRIAALRSQVDRITSRQLLDQQAVEAKVAKLLKQQELIAGRSDAVTDLLDRANDQGIKIPAPVHKPQDNGQASNEKPKKLNGKKTGALFTKGKITLASSGDLLRGSTSPLTKKTAEKNEADNGLRLPNFDDVMGQINRANSAQRQQLQLLANDARRKSMKIISVLTHLKIPGSSILGNNVGGPFIASRNDLEFEDLTDNLRDMLDMLDRLKYRARLLPTGNPVPGQGISSSYGNRVDPFLRRSAFHAGIDFRGKTGTPVRATGQGKVIHAGRKGGYGNLIEIAHGNGVRTRFAHLSKINVKIGQIVDKGLIIGRIGSTGRSTGPHLHYEVRLYGRPVNPTRFLSAGKKLKKLL